jgi:hypothetical protein
MASDGNTITPSTANSPMISPPSMDFLLCSVQERVAPRQLSPRPLRPQRSRRG